MNFYVVYILILIICYLMSLMKLIYVVEDHQVIREGVRRYLENSGYKALTFANLETARQAVALTKPDLLIQDVMLPDGDGFDFVQEIRKKDDIPVVFMTAKIAEEDRLKGFRLGADDYISKPFSPKELVARVQAIFRRLDSSSSNVKHDDNHEKIFKAGEGILKFNDFEHKISVNTEKLSLTSAEWRILKLLVENASKVLTRADILEKCFDYSSESYDRIVDTHIKNLRAKLGDYPWIETVRGYGYRFIAFPVSGEECK